MYNYNKDYEKIKYNKKNSSRKAPTHKVYTQIVDYTTGEVIYEQELSTKKIQAKKGWCRMYPKDFSEALLRIANKTLAIKIYMYLMRYGYFKKDGTIKNFKQKDLANELGVTKSAISKAIKALKDEEIIADIDGELRYNPFLISVINQSDSELYEAQRIWEEYVGHYNYYKEKK